MLKGLAAWVLNTYLGKYLENLNTDQLSIALLQGEVELENIPLKKDALNSFELPLEIRAGFVQKIKVTIPFTRLRSEPWVISIEGLYIVAGPVQLHAEFNEEAEEQNKQFRKLSKLDAIEARWRASHDAQQESSYYATSYSSWFSYGASVVSGIVDNVQLNIYDVHFRYEDSQTNPASPFAWGITINSLTAQSAAKDWAAHFVDRSDIDATRKLMELQNLAVYWDTNATMFGHLPFQQLCDALKQFQTNLSDNVNKCGKKLKFIIEPVSSRARLLRNRDPNPLRSRSSPRFICDVTVDNFLVTLDDDQYQSMTFWMREFDKLEKSRGLVKKGRPTVAVKEDTKAWWRYAIGCQVEDVRKRWSGRNWEYAHRRSKDNVLYVKAYTEHLKNPVTCPVTFREHKDRIELELTFEELMILREVAMDRMKTFKSALDDEEKKKAKGILRSWFPLYRGWYSSSAATPLVAEDATAKSDPVENSSESRQGLEEEILDVLNDTVENDTMLRRDTVFAQVNFTLKKGTFSLCNARVHSDKDGNVATDTSQTLFELGFVEMAICSELRPRTGSIMFKVSLGDMHLCDKVTAGSVFPQLIASHGAGAVFAVQKPLIDAGHYQQKHQRLSSPRHSYDSPLFEFTYESKPFDSTAAFRVHMKSRSLDIVYNPLVLARFREFLASPYRASAGGFRITDAARSRYEELKRQTQDQLKKNLEKILDGEQPSVQQWEIHLQISAPQIIIPENLFDSNTTVIVCDFGHLQFSTASSRVQTKHCDDIQGSDSEEDFKTPCSSPPDDDITDHKWSFMKSSQFQPSLSSVQEISSPNNITEFALHKRMYDSYMLDFSDLQIMVCKATDNWRHAYLRGTSSLHVLDKFTISLQLNRRIVYTNDPLWPNATLLGNLPKLVVHVNEQKIQAVKTCLAILGTSAAKPHRIPSEQRQDDLVVPQDKEMGSAEPLESHCKELQDDSHLLVMQFNVEQMSLEIQSRGRSVAELQVKGIRVKFRKQPHNVSTTLTVHSLLLVDALQTFGPDFELLFASHKNVCIDTMSGSLRDSDPTSPASPTSSYVSVTSPIALNSALSNLQLQQLSSSSALELQSPLFLLDAHDSEALIVIEVTIVDSSHEDDKKPSMCCASVRFNNLDIIANQETIVELLGFLKRTELTNFRRTSNATPLDQEVTKNVINDDLISELATQSLVVTFEFHTLSILLMKSVKKDSDLIGHKIATATMTGAKIQANFGSEVEISGSLGGLQVLDLSDLATKYKKILCVGRDPLEERPLSLTERLHAEVYGAASEWTAESNWEENKAFSFEVTCPASSFTGEDSNRDGDCLSVKLRVASVCYTYTQHFLSELASCASEFRQYAIKLANSIRSAAAEMAYEIVARKTHFVGEAATHPSETVVKSKSQSRSWFAGFQLRLDVVLESPVVLVPESAISGNVLESRLGRITIRNCKLDHTQEEFAETLNLENGTTVKVDVNKSERAQLEIRNINVHSLHWDAASKSTFSYRPQELRVQSDKRFPILHDTAVNVSVDWLVGEGVSQDIDEETHHHASDCHNVWNVAMIEGQVVNSLKVSLVKHQYRQILRTLNYLMTSSKPSETPENWQTSSDDQTDLIFSTDSLQFDNVYIDPKLPLVTEMRQSFAVKAALSLPEFRVELHPGINEMQNDIVALVFQDFLFNLERVDSHRTVVEVTLKGVVMEDLHQEPNSKNRYLMKSSHRTTKEMFAQRAKFLSTSCPDILHHHPILLSQQSLPDKLNTENVFRNFQKREQRMLYGSNYRGRSLEPGASGQYECPYTPPPSPMCNSPEGEQSMADALVNVKVILVDKECPQFSSKYNSINRSVDVNFNALDMIINLQSWVMVLDFFDISNVDTSIPTSKEIRFDISNELIPEEPINTETYVKVRSLTLVFNKDCQEMAKANVSNFYARLTNRDGRFILVGKLGSMSLKDLTGFGQLYPERFLTVGKEALDFTYSKHGQVDNATKHDHDACLKLTMSSVVYVHTNRFYTEMMAFVQHFNQLQTALAMGREQSTAVGHVTRVLLDIQAGSPVILVPRSAFSNQIIVANLGNLTVKNRFLFSGCEGTLGARKGAINEKVFAMTGERCLLDVLSVELQEMDLYSAERLELDKKPGNVQALDINFSSFVVMKRGEPLLKQKCELKLQIERNLHVDFNHAAPDIAVNGEISTVHCSVDVEQYKLIHGILKHNLGEEVEVEIPTVHFAAFPAHPKDQTEIWTCMSFHVDLVNVTLELLVSHRPSSNNQDQSLAQIDLCQSKLTFKRFSDQSREVDLVSQEILVSDTRFKDAPANQRPNVFFHILQPMANSQQGLLQAEINYRSTPVFSRLTVVLNNMRVMAVFDWWSAFLAFISVKDDDDDTQGFPSSYDEMEKLSRSMEVNTHGASKPFSAKYAVSLSSGVVTKRAPLLEEDKLSYEFKINVTETEVVVVEDTASWDSNAVILKSTTVLAYRPMFIEKPLSCSLQSLEVFSCILGLEDDTALSIIDPLTINIDINGRPKPGHSGGLLDATSIGEITHVLEVSLHDLNIHVSYHDMVMFASILESVPRQANLVKHYNGADNVKVKKLQGMGFEAEDCNNALIACQGNLDDAAIWLTQNAATTTVSDTTESRQLKSIDVKDLDIRVACICICLIDDCKDADVPLAELTLSGLHLHQTMGYRVKGTASYVLGGDFYNRALSGWEPFLEPWRCRVTWDKAPLSSRHGNKLSITFKGEDVLNFNLSSTLLQLYRNVKANWTDDYYGLSSKQQSDQSEMKSKFGPTSHVGLRKRTPFVPFALKNSTGSKLHFITATSSPDKLLPADSSGGHMGYRGQGNRNWISVPPGSTVPFTFEGRGKHRHRGTHDVKVHQLIVVVEGWQEMAPVSVDKVGVFFRQARPQINRGASVYTEIPAARVVFAVTLEGQAQKLVTVRSALQIRNRLGEDVTLRMENSVFQLGVSTVTQVKPDSTVAVPLLFTSALLSVCPSSREHQLLFCSPEISWQHVTRQNETREYVFTCLPRSISGRFMGLESYKFCVRVTREKFPLDLVNTGSATSQQRSRGYPTAYGLGVLPGHLITLLPPVTIINLLPYELFFSIQGINSTRTFVKPGKEAAIFSVDVTSSLEISLAIEGFKLCNDLVIPSDCGNCTCIVRLVDSRDRLLFINARISTRFGCSYQVSLLAHYWLVNRSGLPLVFRQEGSGQEAAGQFVEHETARSVSPLMFSFAGGDSPELCSMRVGQSVHADGEPQWCSHFNLEKGIRFRRLKVLAPNFRPEWVYSIGIDVRVGRGQYRDTHIVTLSPRFYIENNSKYQIELTQKFLIDKVNMAKNRLTAMSKSSLPFHWTRVDLEQLLCVRIASVPGCHWSGGFFIEKIDSFHINMRDAQGKSCFLRVEVVLQGATYRVIFVDADQMPPPYRIDNLSEVPITFQQTDVSMERLRTVVRPGAKVPYAWDEPTLRPLIDCCAHGGISATYNMNQFGEGKKLSYENFIYVAFDITFHRHPSSFSCKQGDYRCQELVLDVPTGTRVVLSKKEPSKRTQLWRMTTTGLLQHEGSSPPRDPKRSSSVESDRVLVLDIADIGSSPNTYVGLILRKPDQRRSSTQTWKFTEDGRLCCQHRNLYVQPKDGLHGLRPGNDVVLGQTQMICLVMTDSGIPVEQAICRQRLRPGSGILDVKVVPDGPTRVLQVSDIRGKTSGANIPSQSDWVIVEKTPAANSETKREASIGHISDMQLVIHLPEGMGLSFVNHVPEELVYIFFKNITLDLVKTGTEETANGTVESFTVNNQLFDAELPVLMFVTPSLKTDSRHHLPAITFTAHRVPSTHQNVDIFKLVMVDVKNVTVQIEERLLWKLMQFFRGGECETEFQERDHEFHMRNMHSVTSVQAKRYYFNNLKLILNQMRLSVITSSRLPADLKDIKHKMGLTLVRFADAQVELDPFVRVHPFETAQFILDAILEHYKEELKSQAAKILGAVDFLGNPLGLMNDVTEGLSGLVNEGNFGGLVKNVTHGLSNSAAKVMGTLSEGLSVVTMDDKHQEKRKKISSEQKAGSSDHIMAGLKGLGVGLLGGVTSIFTQTYEGASSEGFPGFISGFGKGLVGTVTKPAAGVLDFATGAASAVRDTSRSSIHEVPERPRPTRLCVGPDGLLPKYSWQQARGQARLYALNRRDYTERFFGYEQLSWGSEGLFALISDRRVYILGHDTPSADSIISPVELGELLYCRTDQESSNFDTKHYIELVKQVSTNEVSPISGSIKRPKFVCDTESIAVKVAQQINYAKSFYDDRVHTLVPSNDSDD